jgi:hypothetical protein
MESIDRIQRAKIQYENLLLNLGSGALDDDSISMDQYDLTGKVASTYNYDDIGVGEIMHAAVWIAK